MDAHEEQDSEQAWEGLQHTWYAMAAATKQKAEET